MDHAATGKPKQKRQDQKKGAGGAQGRNFPWTGRARLPEDWLCVSRRAAACQCVRDLYGVKGDR
jgi:hypothetical protein